MVAGSLMATATSIAQAPSHLRNLQTSAPSLSKHTNQKARIFITGSADGLGYAAAKTLLTNGYQVVVHVRSQLGAPLCKTLLIGEPSRQSGISPTSRRRVRPRQPSQ